MATSGRIGDLVWYVFTNMPSVSYLVKQFVCSQIIYAITKLFEPLQGENERVPRLAREGKIFFFELN